MLLHSATLYILTQAAENALDFKMRDAKSRTTLADCIQSNYEEWEAEDTVTAAEIEVVLKQLRALGYRF